MTVWKTIPSFPLYQASDEGRIRRDPDHPSKRGAKRDMLAICPNDKGYAVYRLTRDGALFGVTGHRLVCEAFHGPAPDPSYEVAHGDGVKLNCRPENLRWATRKDNHADKITHGTMRCGETAANAKLTEVQVREIKVRFGSREASRAIASAYGVKRSTIDNIRLGKTWKHLD